MPKARRTRKAGQYANIRSAPMPNFTSVQVVHPWATPPPPQPTNADILKAIDKLSSMVSELSKNQQAIEQRLSDIRNGVYANYLNIQNGASWIDYVLQVMYDYLIAAILDGTQPPEGIAQIQGYFSGNWKG